MPRQPRIEHLIHLISFLDPNQEYLVAQLLTKNLFEGKSLVDFYGSRQSAKSSLHQYFKSRGIEALDKDGRSYRFSGEAIINALRQDAEMPTATSAPVLEAETSSVPSRLTGFLVAGFGLVGFFFMVTSWGRPSTDQERIKNLQDSGDVAGLRLLNRETAIVKDVREQEDLEAEAAEIRSALGVPDLVLQYDEITHLEYPLGPRIAEAIAQIEKKVIHVRSLADLVAVFPGLRTWVLWSEDRLVSIHLGSRLKLADGRGDSGIVTRVSMDRLELKTDRGETQLLERPPFELFEYSETDKVGTVIYPLGKGNLTPLLKWAANELSLGFENQAAQAGQIAGFFPLFSNVEAFLDELAPLGVSWSDHSVTLKSQPQPKILIGDFHETIFRSFTLDQLLTHFDKLTPQKLEWMPFGDRSFWYSGQQLLTVLNQFNLHTSYNHNDNKLFLLREKRL